MAVSFRDAPFGQMCRVVLGPRVFCYPDEKEGFQFPVPEAEIPISEKNKSDSINGDVEKAEQVSSPSNSQSGHQNVGWYSDSDPENPLMWSTAKKTFTYFQICLLTFSGQLPPD